MQILLTKELWQEIHDFYKNKPDDNYNNYSLGDICVWAYEVMPNSREHLIANIEPRTPIFELCRPNCIPIYCTINTIFDTIKYEIVKDVKKIDCEDLE